MSSRFRDFLRAPNDPRLQGLPERDACQHAAHIMSLPATRALFEEWLHRYEHEPFTGITCDGHCRHGLYPLLPGRDDGAPVAAAVHAARQLLAHCEGDARAKLCHPLQAREWRAWMNPEVYLQRHGLRLDEETPTRRELALALVQASLSAPGYLRVRNLMRINHFLGELVNAPRVMNEYSYNINLFGEPSLAEPWGWTLYGHHLCLACLMVGGRMMLAPVFMGAEPHCIDAGPWAGVREFEREEQQAWELMHALPAGLRRRAQLHAQKRGPSLPPGRVAFADELNLAGAYRDNRIVPYEGVCAAEFDGRQRRQLMDLAECYLESWPEGPRAARLAELEAHLDETWWCWIGGLGTDDPFYYRLQSPVVLIEFDHHAGVFLGNTEPQRFHVHTVVRAPNGNDYGMDWVRQHCEATQRAMAARGECVHADTFLRAG